MRCSVYEKERHRLLKIEESARARWDGRVGGRWRAKGRGFVAAAREVQRTYEISEGLRGKRRTLWLGWQVGRVDGNC
jgi:hypothetical protein